MAAQEAQQEAEQEAPQQEAEQEAPQPGIGGETDPEAETGDPMGEGDVAGGSSSARRFRYYSCIVLFDFFSVYPNISSKFNWICLCRYRKCNSIRPRPAERTLIKPRGEW